MSAAGDSGTVQADEPGQSRHLPPPLPGVLVTGWPAYPADTAAGLSRRAGLQFAWLRERQQGGWEEAGDGLSYTPSDADLGRRLRLVGRRAGAAPEEEPEFSVESAPVRAGPGPCPAERGLRLTTEPLGPDG